MNSREKGKRGERQWRDELRANGYMARRGQQFSGSPDSPDVVCEELSFLHFEVKAVERLNIEEAMEQARRDCRGQSPGSSVDRCAGEDGAAAGCKPAIRQVENLRYPKVPIVAHRRNFRPWLVTMEAETFFKLLRGDFLQEGAEGAEGNSKAGDGARLAGARLRLRRRRNSGNEDFKGLCGLEKSERKTKQSAFVKSTTADKQTKGTEII